MISTYLAVSGVAEQPGDYAGTMYEPVTIPTAYPYAIPAPSTAEPAQQAPSPNVVPLNAYVQPQASVSPVTPTATTATTAATTSDCGCTGGVRPLQWYEIVSAIAIVVLIFTAFRKAS